MKKNKIMLILVSLIACFLIIACVNPMSGGEEDIENSKGLLVVTISGNKSRKAVGWSETLDSDTFSHMVIVSDGPGTAPVPQTIPVGGGTAKFSVTPGLWKVSVEAHYFGDVVAEGSKTVQIKAGSNNEAVIIDMHEPTLNPLPMFTVTFDSKGGTAVPPETVKKYNKVSQPSPNPTHSSDSLSVFSKWYKEDDTEYNFSDPVTANITLYGSWTADAVIVQFKNKDGSSTSISNERIGRGTTIGAPTITKSGYTAAWYTDQYCVRGNEWDFAQNKFNADTTLYLDWLPKEYEVTYDPNGGTPANPALRIVGWDDINLFPTETISRTGYTLNGWKVTVGGVLNRTVSTASSYSSLVANDGIMAIQIQAQWTANTVTIKAVPGVTAPVVGATPVTTITPTAQYTGTVSWNGNPAAFAALTSYTATITLTAINNYTLDEVAANFFTVAGATSVSNAANSGVITASFPATAAAVINIPAIPGVTAPVVGATPVTAITETAQYTGSVAWKDAANNIPVTFAGSTVYTATITLTAKTGFTLTGVGANFFTVAGTSSAATNSANSGVITASFPATAAAVINIPAIPGVTSPVLGATPVTTITATDQYTGTVSWKDAANNTPATFAAATVYTATITLTPKAGFTLTGVTANFFTVANATTVNYTAGSNTVTATFPSTSAAVISIPAIPGVTAPVVGATPVTAITETAQYSGTVTWKDAANNVPTTFAGSTAYTATITLTPKAGFTLTGVGANFFTVAGTSSPATNSANSGVITATFPATAAAVINIAAIPGVTAPVLGATPVTSITATDQYTGTVTWKDAANNVPTTFAGSATYTATITLTAKTGFTLTGVGANFFTVAGASTVSNAANSGVITASFSATAAAVINIAAIPGVTAPVLGATPVTSITATDQYTGTVTWKDAANNVPTTFAGSATYTATITLTAKTGFTLTGVGANFFTVAGTSSAVTNSANSGVITAVFPSTSAAVISIPAIPGVTAPVVGATPVTAITETAQYSGTVTWKDAANNVPTTFAGSATYTATITLTAKTGFTLTGVGANFFTVAGTSSAATNSANSGVITASFPSTSAAVINIAAIPGVTAPVLGATPVTTITATDQYTGTVTWKDAANNVPTTFAGSTAYTATITLTAKTGFTLTGVGANFFTVAGTSSAATNSANSGVITAVFPATAAAVINIAAIPGVTAPVLGATPVTTITATDQYTGTVSWSGNPSTFAGSTAYTATITLSPKAGFTLTGVAGNFFTVTGATTVNYTAGSNTVTATFPATAYALTIVVTPPTQPATPINLVTTFTVAVSGFNAPGDANNVKLLINSTLVSGHETVGNASGGTKTFNVTITHPVSPSNSAVNVNVTGLDNIPAGYGYAGGSKAVTDAVKNGTSAADVIPVYSANFGADYGNTKNFNTYANTNGLAKYYKLMDDVALTGTWTPISTFTGSFDGGGKQITLGGSVTINKVVSADNSSSCAGLFGEIDSTGVVKNLRLRGNSIANENPPQNNPIAGAVAAINRGKISNISSSVNVFVRSNTGIPYGGGIAGRNMTGGIIENCYATAIMPCAQSTSSDAYFGAIAGSNEGTIRNCWEEGGYATATGGTGYNGHAGGIAGSNTGSISNCVALTGCLECKPYSSIIGRIAPAGAGTFTNNYGLQDMWDKDGPTTWTSNKNGKDGEDVNNTPRATLGWWTGTAGWTLGGTNESNPWKWDSTEPCPILWFESDFNFGDG